ncbi:MAG: ABC transporter permease, partial [Clostridia bacterium]|nr:ABC transporter permease [Clostridia bacterium]
FTFIACMFTIWFSDIGNILWKDILVISFLASLGAPMNGLLINIFAQNKIEGFAIMKLLGTIVILPVIALFFTDAKELFFAIFPAFWPAKMISSVIWGDAKVFLNYNLYFGIGLAYLIGANILIYIKFIRKVAE